MNKIAEYVNNELNRIAFFIHNADVLEKHLPSRTNKALLNLPVTWDKHHILINNKKEEDVTEDDYIERIGLNQRVPISVQLKGTINSPHSKDDSFTLKIVFQDREYNYSLEFKDGTTYGKTKNITSLKTIAKIINERAEHGSSSEERDIREVYKKLFSGNAKNTIREDILSKFLPQYKDLNWKSAIKLVKERGLIRLQIYTLEEDPKKYKEVFSLFTKDDPERARFKLTDLLKKDISAYLSSYIQDNGFPEEAHILGIFKPNIDEEGNPFGKLGFTITIR